MFSIIPTMYYHVIKNEPNTVNRNYHEIVLHPYISWLNWRWYRPELHFVGESTVWHELHNFRRPGTSMEFMLSEIYYEYQYKKDTTPIGTKS